MKTNYWSFIHIGVLKNYVFQIHLYSFNAIILKFSFWNIYRYHFLSVLLPGPLLAIDMVPYQMQTAMKKMKKETTLSMNVLD